MHTRWRVNTDCCSASAVLLCSDSSAVSAASMPRPLACCIDDAMMRRGSAGFSRLTGNDACLPQ